MTKEHDFFKVHARALLLIMCMLFSAQSTWADDYLQNTMYFTAIPQGIDKIRFTLPTQYDGNQNEGIRKGYIYYTVDGGTQMVKLLEWGLYNHYNELTSDDESGPVDIQVYEPGTWQLVGKTKGGYQYFTVNTCITLGPDDSNDDHFTTVVDWTVDLDMRGHKYTFYLWCQSEDIGHTWYIPSNVKSANVDNTNDWYKMAEWDCPAASKVSISLNDPMLSYSTDHPGTIMIPYTVEAKSVTSATAYYTDAITGTTYSQKLTDKILDYIYIPADRPWKDIYVNAKVKDFENYNRNVNSVKVATNMLHFPVNLEAQVLPSGKVSLTWKVNRADLDDFDDSDNFELQRNVNGSIASNDDGWTTISMEDAFEKNKDTYSYTDTTLLDRYKNKPVAYRVRRSVAGIWNWKSGSGVSMDVVPAVLALPGFTEASVQRTDTWNDEEHIVKFNYKSGPKYDNEGRFIVHNDNEWAELQEMVGRGEASYDKAVMVLLNQDDWKSFVARTSDNYQRSLNAVMLDDIDISDCQDMVGTKLYAYNGTFDGFGHTLTVNYSGNQQFIAPFSEVYNATIRDLTIAGTITSSAKFAGGLIGTIHSGGNVTIERCVVMADMKCQVEGDASSGGVIGWMDASSVNITNTSFIGTIQGDKCNNNGGFVGVAGPNCVITMTNCLFSPAFVPADMTGCSTFARKDKAATLTLNNCYYTMSYCDYETDGQSYFIVGDEDGWMRLQKIVNDANKGTKINAILTADITITDMLGSDDKPYCGIFDGNGHTITANINTAQWAAAPFRIVGDVTIKNLHVTGSVTGGRHAAGLIGARDGTPDIHVEKVWVSANVTTTDRYLGGIIGHVGGANAYISDTRFDGTLTASKEWYDETLEAIEYNEESWHLIKKDIDDYATFGGAIIGWGGEGGWFFHRVYDHSTSKNVYWYFYCIDSSNNLANRSWGGNGVSTNTTTRNSWANVTNHDKSDQDEVLALMNAEKADSWQLTDGMAVPVATSVSVNRQGTSAEKMTLAELKTALGDDQWYETDGLLRPLADVTNQNNYYVTLWDSRAKFMLYSKMKGENGVTTNMIDFSGNEDAVKKHEFTYNLTRKCVEYDFDLVVKRGTSSLMIAGTQADTLAYHVTKKEGADASYKFVNLNEITSVSPEKKQSSVGLTWETSGGESDYYRVLRRLHAADENAAWTDTIATNLVQQFYEDNTVLIQQVYDYRVESILQCEGMHIKYAVATGAQCEPTGRISGYLRMADGTAMAGDTVICKPVGEIIGASAQYVTVTDEVGFYEFTGLPYQGTGTYQIYVKGGGFTGPNADGTVTFSQNSNWSQGFNYYMDNYYIYSGNVFYRDTSIPVPGVSFKLDGILMRDANQKEIITDTQGAFSLSIPAGSHSVQAVKEGHFFANDGFLINKDAVAGMETMYNFNTNVSSVYLWDSTTVVLRGRVIGGDDQGSLPLGESMSVNNLGDSIKIVMQLEGDNASYLIRIQGDETVKSADYQYTYGLDNRDTTRVNVTRHTITVRPENKTGEYLLTLHPAKYKVIEVSAQGYTTLFQEGKVGETLDLSFNVQGDTCEYNRIYHAIPTVDVKQFNVGDEPYFGVKKVTAADNIGNKAVINTWYWKKTGEKDSIGVYSFNYPVFMCNSPYGWMLQACEKYYYNNNSSNEPDIVKLKGGKVTIKNGMISGTDTQELTLDENGGASYIFTPKNTTALQTDESALMNVSITLEYDNSFFDIKPMNGEIFKAYVMATKAKAEGRKSVASSIPQLIDILRDPPGGNSSAYLEAGSKLSYTYNADMNGSAGVTFSYGQGENASIYKGQVVIPSMGGAGTEAGTFTDSKKKNIMSVDLITYYSQGWNFSYNFDVTERVQTSTSKKWIGGKADVFIGMTTEVMVEDAIALRVVPDSMYQIYKTHEGGTFKATDSLGNTAKFKVLTGTAKVLVKGIDDTGKPIYLIRDEVMALGPKLNSTFVHSQHYIENELIPDLLKVRNALILPMGTSAEYAQALADKNKRTTYVSKVAENDVTFGYTNSYQCYYPEEGIDGDSIRSLNQTIEAWLYILAQNERQKIEVSESDLVKRYDFDGGANIQYSESFSASQTNSRSLRYPGINDLGQVTTGILSVIQTFIKAFEKTGVNAQNKPQEQIVQGENNSQKVEVSSGGKYFILSFQPVLALNFTDKSGMSQSKSKKVGFTLSASSKSSLTVDVYRTANEQTMTRDGDGSFANMTLDVLDMLRYGKLGSNPTDYLSDSERVYSSFVFRTRGGVTCEPYEKERTTKWYQPGTVIDVATVPADKPKIWIEEPVVSNVPYDEPARFTLHMANESDYPERASLVFNYYLLASSNPNGAKVYVDGNPITSQGVNITLYPCRDNNNEVVVFTKQIEVYPGKEFDYNDLTLCLYDPEDASRVFDCKFSAHFVPTAGKVNVTSPGSNWVVNTESPYDGKRQAWYLPVTIDGFDTNYRGFDHIELQYKLSTQGDKDWVNVCSYYADRDLMAKASGVTDTIPSNGVIVASFYGEVDPIEQYYDIRAVNYCRHGNGFLTRSSDILSGIKDTRRPVAFGTPEPTDGILDIGDDIIIKFSEPIAGNYLRKINNFEMLGTKNSNDITTSTSLTFTGTSLAYTQGTRNLAGKNFTIDVMLDPADEKIPMTVFSHGGDENGLRFGLSADRKLTATINGQSVESDQTIPFNHALREVAYAVDQTGDNMTVSFYDQSDLIGKKTLTGKYEESSQLKVGFHGVVEDAYQGDMLEMRLWNRAMTSNDLDTYGRKTLNGYETGLLDYYPMNEGEGTVAYDKAPGSMDLSMWGTTWKRPSGLSVGFKGDKGLVLNPTPFDRSKMHDYTLMFWFRESEQNVTLFSNGKAERGDDNKINIGMKDANLYVRSAGFERMTNTAVNEGKWHHFAMTVSRSQNVANVYIDKRLIDTFAADSLSGISGDSIALGATYADRAAKTNVMTGNIDEVGMFASVLPLNLIKEYANHTPLGTTSPLMAYLSFEQSVNSDDNTQMLVASGESLKRYVDSQAKIQDRRDILVAEEVVKTFADKDYYAPMVSSAKLENINYNFVANANELYISVNEPDYMVEKTNLYVTAKEVPDLQGNLMASPITLNLYVYRNPLRWDVKRIDQDINYGEGMTFEATVKNMSGLTQNFNLQDLPVWITASQTAGTIAALDEQVITFTVSPYINIGTYNEQVSLIGDNKMTEPLPITLRVRGCEPEWAVSDLLKQQKQTMMMVARVKIDGVVSNSEEDILAVFDENQQTLGVAHIELKETANANEALAYLTIYGYTNPDGSKPKLNFRFFKAQKGSVYKLIPEDGKTYTFEKDALLGSSTNPVVLKDDPLNNVWWLDLKKGWNWVTIPVVPLNKTVGQFLNDMTIWEAGDMITTVDGSDVQQYTCIEDKNAARGYRWSNEDQPITIKGNQMYSIYSMSDKTVYLEGLMMALGYVKVHKDWNRIGYLSPINLPISQALSDYAEKAQEGDVIKSQDEFAVACSSPNGMIWKGSLQYMEAGKGYMLKRVANSDAEFYYPQYFSENRYSGSSTSQAPRLVSTATTMNIVAAVEGFETEVGDRLVVFSGAERMAEAVADDEQNYYLNIGSDAKYSEPLTFVIERDGETVAMTGSRISYAPNKVLGTPSSPTAISFTALDQMPHDGQWYNVGGNLIGKKPTQSGVYIYNGKAVVVK
jgi:hypothetical protein